MEIWRSLTAFFTIVPSRLWQTEHQAISQNSLLWILALLINECLLTSKFWSLRFNFFTCKINGFEMKPPVYSVLINITHFYVLVFLRGENRLYFSLNNRHLFLAAVEPDDVTVSGWFLTATLLCSAWHDGVRDRGVPPRSLCCALNVQLM